MEKRVFLIVLDSFGIGAEPDAAAFGDEGTNTLGAIAKHPNFNCPNLKKLGLFNIDGVTVGEKDAAPIGSFARLQEQSMGKDTTCLLYTSLNCRPAASSWCPAAPTTT